MFGNNVKFIIADYGSALPTKSRDVMYVSSSNLGCLSFTYNKDKALRYSTYAEAMKTMFEIYEILITMRNEQQIEALKQSLHIETIENNK
jgi:hypothetical protein